MGRWRRAERNNRSKNSPRCNQETAPTCQYQPSPARQSQARLRNRIGINFRNVRAQWPGGNSDFHSDLRAGNIAKPNKYASPVMGSGADSPCQGEMARRARGGRDAAYGPRRSRSPSDASPVAFCLLCRHGQSRSPPAGAKAPTVQETQGGITMQYKLKTPVTRVDLAPAEGRGHRPALGHGIHRPGRRPQADDGAAGRGRAPPLSGGGLRRVLCGPTPERPGEVIGSAGPTTSGRMDAYSPACWTWASSS